ncbi:MAG: CRISPR-associated protein Csx15 [Terriglobales bacterium]
MVGLPATEWQQVPLLLNLPSLSVIASMVLAEIHGRIGHFPAVMRLRPTLGPRCPL